jgi:hypothetical protein
MDTGRLRSALEALIATDPDHLGSEELESVVSDASALRSWIDAYEVRCARRSRQLADAGQAPPPESLLGRAGRRSGKDATMVTERDRVCNETSHFEAALAAGTVSSGHLDALANATRRLDDDLRAEFFANEGILLDAASKQGVDTFERQCRDLSRHLVASSQRSDVDELEAQRARANVKRWVDKTTGMHHSHLELDPISDAKLWTAIDRHLRTARQADGNARTPWQRLQVDALVSAVSSAPAGEKVIELSVLVDLETITHGWHDHSLCETEDGVPLPVDTVRRMCCDAEILPVVLGGEGEVLDVGRSRRTVNRAQRRALRSMHRTCAHPDCTVPFSACPIHHVRWWFRDRGPTDIDNLIPLCERHHHLVHEGGWTLTMNPDRVVTWTRPDGTVHWSGSSIDRTTTDTPRSRARSKPLRGTARTTP